MQAAAEHIAFLSVPGLLTVFNDALFGMGHAFKPLERVLQQARLESFTQVSQPVSTPSAPRATSLSLRTMLQSWTWCQVTHQHLLGGGASGSAALCFIVSCQSRRVKVIICIVPAHQLLRVCIEICSKSDSVLPAGNSGAS